LSGTGNHTSQAAANGSRRALRHVKRRQHGRGAHTETGDEAANVHDGETAVGDGAGLEDYANGCDHAGSNQGPSTAPPVGQPGGNETRGEASGLQGRGDWKCMLDLIISLQGLWAKGLTVLRHVGLGLGVIVGIAVLSTG